MSDAGRTPKGGREKAGQLGPFDIGCVVVGGIVGVGIFFTPAKVAAKVDGPAQVMGAWGLGATIAILGALVFAELACRVPGHGGTFVYIERGIGRLPAFLYGWANCFFIQAGACGIVGLILIENLSVAMTGEASLSGDVEVLLAAVTIAIFVALNLLGLRVGKRVQNSLTVLKVGLIAGLVLLAVTTAGSGSEAPAAAASAEPRGWLLALSGAILPVLFSFGGWQQGSFVAGAARRPQRDLPIGILAGVAVVVACYLTINLAFLSILGFEGAAASSTIAVDASRKALEPHGVGDLAGRLVGAMVAISAMGILNTICLAPPYVLHSMARRGLFFRRAATLHPRFGNPSFGILVQGLAAIGLLLLAHLGFGQGSRDTLGFVLDGVVFVDWLFFGLAGLALLRLRRMGGGEAPAFRAPCGTLVATIFAALSIAVMAGAIWSSREASLVGLGITLAGIPFFRKLESSSHGAEFIRHHE